MAELASKRVTTSTGISWWARWNSRSSAAGPIRRLITSTRSGRRPGRMAASARASARSRSRAAGRNALPVCGELDPASGPGEQPYA